MQNNPNDREVNIVFHASPTIARWMDSNALYRGLMGPVRGGKSSACCIEIYLRSLQQSPAADGVRYTRWIVIRNTYRELLDTTIKTWQDWFRPEYYGELNKNTMTHILEVDCDDGTKAHIEVLFRALDRPDDIKKLLSLEVTGAWVNEVREIPKGVVDTLGDRVGQFPAQKDGGPSWRGVIMDTNPPDEDHWWYRLAEEETPYNWEFFKQPGGLIEVRPEVFEENPAAENIGNLEPSYYLNRVGGKSLDYIRVYYCGQYGFVSEGKPVFPEYFDITHCQHCHPVTGLPIYVGLDFGLTPAAVFTQRLANGKWIWFDELVSEDMGISQFADVLGPKLRGEYAGYTFELWGDPAGASRSQTDEKTCFQILAQKGIKGSPCHSNDFTMRRESLAVALGRMIDGKPGFAIDPRCKMTRKALAGGYCYRRMRIAGEDRFHDAPDKNRYSHPAEAGCYAMVGAGEGRQLVAGNKPKLVVQFNSGKPKSLGWMGA